MIQYDKIDISDILVIIALSILAIMAVFYANDQLAMSIASGLIGYLGGSKISKNEENYDGNQKNKSKF